MDNGDAPVIRSMGTWRTGMFDENDRLTFSCVARPGVMAVCSPPRCDCGALCCILVAGLVLGLSILASPAHTATTRVAVRNRRTAANSSAASSLLRTVIRHLTIAALLNTIRRMTLVTATRSPFLRHAPLCSVFSLIASSTSRRPREHRLYATPLDYQRTKCFTP